MRAPGADGRDDDRAVRLSTEESDADGRAAIFRTGTSSEVKGKRIGMSLNRKRVVGLPGAVPPRAANLVRVDPFA